jgi:lysozyme family protein
VSNFDEAVNLVLKHEGGYVDDPLDPGGATNFGICKRDHPSLDIFNLSKDEAKKIYKEEYWLTLYDQIADQKIANTLFDFGVNSGLSRAVKTLQKILNDVMSGPFVVDGIFGPATLAATNACDSTKLLEKFTQSRIAYYTSLNKPRFIKGWIARATDYA